MSISNAPPAVTNNARLGYTGSASVTQGTIAKVEYSVDGRDWLSAQATDGNFNGGNETYAFTTQGLPDGTHTIRVRATSSDGTTTREDSYAQNTVTVVTTPPEVVLNSFSGPTEDTTPTVSGTARASLSRITKVEVSFDNGQTYIPANLFGVNFSLEAEPLEDGNYKLVARAYDAAGNIGVSKSTTLIVDTMPPIVGAGLLTIGPQILRPAQDGAIHIVKSAQTNLVMSMKGGVTEAKFIGNNLTSPFRTISNTNLWVAKIKFSKEGAFQPFIRAVDGANNRTERRFNKIVVDEPGILTDSKSLKRIQGAAVSVYYFEKISQKWILWEGSSYGQTNPQKTNKDGEYSFLLPRGKYYLEIKAPGYKTTQSEITEIARTSVINERFDIKPKKGLSINLPILGSLSFYLPQLTPPETQPISKYYAAGIYEASVKNTSFDGIEYALFDLAGKEYKLESIKGIKTLVSFMASWSPTSQEQAKILSEVYSQLPEDQSMLVIFLQEGVSGIKSFMNRGGYNFPTVVDVNGTLAEGLNFSLLPYHLLFDAKGRVAAGTSRVLNANEVVNLFDYVK